MSDKKSEKSISKRKIKVIIVLIFLVLIVAFIGINLRANYLEVLELGQNYLQAYNQNLQYKLYTFIVTFLIIFMAMYITTKFTIKGLKVFFNEEKKEIPKLANKSISLIVAVVIALIFNTTITESFSLALNSTVFGIGDPVFNLDIAYYILQKPFIEMILIYLMVLGIALCIYTTVYYIVVFNRYFDGIDPETLKRSLLIRQLIVLAKIVAVILGIFALVKTQDILYSNFINLEVANDLTVSGAGLVDTTLKLWGFRLLAILIVVSIWRALDNIRKGEKKKALISVLAVPVYLVILFILLIIFNFLFVNRNELDTQKNYITYNINSTRNAYNINIDEVEIESAGTITLEQVEENKSILNNVSIVDEDVTLNTLKEYKSNVGYYTFNNTQIAKYNDNLIYLTPREILTSSVSNINKTYQYTHGFSAIITSAVETDKLGNVKYIQDDYNANDNSIVINEPRIYFGLETTDDIIVDPNKQSEFDYPITTTQNETNSYNGKAGLKLGFWDRIILGIKEKNINIIFGKNMTSTSKIILNRQVVERAKIAMPDLLYDDEPYLVVTDEGRLVWVIDAYTVTNKYPYSTLTTIENNGNKMQINYIRNSVKVLVDATDGTMNFYITDRTDPLIMVYKNMYPSIFEDLETELPNDIKSHLVYPDFLYKIQAEVLTAYHNVQAEVLYRNDDLWDIASYNSTITTTNKTTQIEPIYTMVQEDGERIGLVLPYTKLGNKNLISYLVGTYLDNGESRLKLYKYNSNNTVLGPSQLDRQIEEDQTISKELKSINVTGSKITKNVIIVPIENTVLYVEPVYQTLLNESDIPVLKKVIVASGSKLAIGDNLKDALDNLLSQYAVEINLVDAEDINDLIELIIKANTNLKNSSNSGNWELTGKDIATLQELVNQLEVMKKEVDDEADKAENETEISLTVSQSE